MYISHTPKLAVWIEESFPLAYRFLMDNFQEPKSVYVVGGIIRDYFENRVPNDLDATVDGITSQDLRRIPELECITFPPDSVRGMAKIGNIQLDIWPLQETLGLREFGLPPNIESVLKRAALSIDKIALELRTGVLYDDGCIEALKCRTISYDPYRPYMETIHAGRILMYQQKTGYALDPSALDHVKKVCGNISRSDLNEITLEVNKKYPLLVQPVLDEILKYGEQKL